MFHNLLMDAARQHADNTALTFKLEALNYADLALQVEAFARGLAALGLKPQQRVAIYLPKQFETVIAMFAITLAGGVFVPVNPQLKAQQVNHILTDCDVSIFISSFDRLGRMQTELAECPAMEHIISIDKPVQDAVLWQDVQAQNAHPLPTLGADASQMAAILYTSGSTGKPKGVVLSHNNLLLGADSVSTYLGNHAEDRLLAALPFSFDYGLSQVTTAFKKGASVSLLNYLFPNDVLKAMTRERITGLAGVPPLWIQLARLEWPQEAAENLRYITNSGGHMPLPTLQALRSKLPNTTPFLMYGLTEAFRSTYLPPAELDKRPASMGKAIPHAKIMVVTPEGEECKPGEIGELVHLGPLVSLGYWNDEKRTKERFKPAPKAHGTDEIAVWSGDKVKTDEDGFLYFVGRDDEMIKTSGYRVSPTEVEEVALKSGLVDQAVALGVKHEQLGQAVVLAYSGAAENETDLMKIMKQELPAFMLPARLVHYTQMPVNANGKLDRSAIKHQLADLFQPAVEE